MTKKRKPGKYTKSNHLHVREIPDYACAEASLRRSGESFARLQNVKATFCGVTLEKLDENTVLELDKADGITVDERK